MANIKELHLILELIKKHDLPLSPILEYAIKERERQYSESPSSDGEMHLNKFDVPKEKGLSDYASDFSSLSVAIS